MPKSLLQLIGRFAYFASRGFEVGSRVPRFGDRLARSHLSILYFDRVLNRYGLKYQAIHSLLVILSFFSTKNVFIFNITSNAGLKVFTIEFQNHLGRVWLSSNLKQKYRVSIRLTKFSQNFLPGMFPCV